MSAAAKLREWREQPITFVREVFGAEPDAWQAEVLQAFPTQPRIALQACKGPGKSTAMAWCGWNFLATRPHPKVIGTSITGDNLRDGLWTEFSKWQQRSPFLMKAFHWGAERIVNREKPETWWASARQWSKGADASQQANTLAGIHADYVLFLVDEAGGIPDAVMSAAEGALSTGLEVKLFIAGNPTHLEGPLYRAATREKHLWWRREITGDPDDTKRAPRISVDWAREQIAKYGRDNPWVLVNVFGKFPPGSSNTLLSVEDANAATQRSLPESEYISQPRILGVDVARFGDDRTVVLFRQGGVCRQPRVFRNLDTMQTADQTVTIINRWAPDAVFIDQTGVGAGVVDRLRQLGYPILGVDFGSKAIESNRFVNRRAEMWWKMSDWVRNGGCIPDDSELVGELTAPTYKYDSGGRLQLESKADMKVRGVPSPDIADALALTFALPVAARGLELPRNVPRISPHPRGDYDPYGTPDAAPTHQEGF